MARISKKAVFFSIVSLFIVILFVATSELRAKSNSGESEIEVTRIRVKVLNSMIKDMENTYFDRLLYIAAKNSLVGLSRYYYDNQFDSEVMQKSLGYALQDVIDDGILERGGNKYNLTKMGYINSTYTLNNLILNISGLFEKLNVDVKELKVTLSTFDSLEQTDPWTIKVKADIKYDLMDKNKLASWKGTTTRIVYIPVFGMYGYDSESGPRSNRGIITNAWKADNGTTTEASFIRKLGYSVNNGKGICKSYCETE
jgi:hypothetical protein